MRIAAEKIVLRTLKAIRKIIKCWIVDLEIIFYGKRQNVREKKKPVPHVPLFKGDYEYFLSF